MQLTHYNSRFNKRKYPITLVCDNVANAANVGSLFRIADAFGIEKLIFCGEHIPIGRKMTKTSRATENIVNYDILETTSGAVEELKNKGYQIISLEIANTSKPIHTLKFSSQKPIALIIGDENFGVSEAILKSSDIIMHINMFGQNSSMNVAVATGIALYEITKQLF